MALMPPTRHCVLVAELSITNAKRKGCEKRTKAQTQVHLQRNTTFSNDGRYAEDGERAWRSGYTTWFVVDEEVMDSLSNEKGRCTYRLLAKANTSHKPF